MNEFGFLLTKVYTVFQFQFNILGYTVSFESIFLFTICICIVGFFLKGVFK